MLKLQKEYIDVDYTEVDEEKNNGANKDITINTDPFSAAISGIFGAVNNVTNAVKEYNICKQQEQTKRTAIKAQMKIEMENIHAKKELCMKLLEEQHEIKMLQIKTFYQQFEKSLKDVSNAVQGAIEVAKETKDFSAVCDLLEIERQILKESSEAELKQMEFLQSTNSPQIENNIAGFLK